MTNEQIKDFLDQAVKCSENEWQDDVRYKVLKGSVRSLISALIEKEEGNE